MKLIDYIVNVFVMVDDFCKIESSARRLRARGPLPKLADSEVITMELLGEYLGFHAEFIKQKSCSSLKVATFNEVYFF